MCFKLWISDDYFLLATPTFNIYSAKVYFLVDHFKLFWKNQGTKNKFTLWACTLTCSFHVYFFYIFPHTRLDFILIHICWYNKNYYKVRCECLFSSADRRRVWCLVSIRINNLLQVIFQSLILIYKFRI